MGTLNGNAEWERMKTLLRLASGPVLSVRDLTGRKSVGEERCQAYRSHCIADFYLAPLTQA